MTMEDPNYRREYKRLAELCQEFADTWETAQVDPDMSALLQLLTGQIVGQCANIYNRRVAYFILVKCSERSEMANNITIQDPVDPICPFHNKRWSEHESGRCLFCCVCFKTLTPDECWSDPAGTKWDICPNCHENEMRT